MIMHEHMDILSKAQGFFFLLFYFSYLGCEPRFKVNKYQPSFHSYYIASQLSFHNSLQDVCSIYTPPHPPTKSIRVGGCLCHLCRICTKYLKPNTMLRDDSNNTALALRSAARRCVFRRRSRCRLGLCQFKTATVKDNNGCR